MSRFVRAKDLVVGDEIIDEEYAGTVVALIPKDWEPSKPTAGYVKGNANRDSSNFSTRLVSVASPGDSTELTTHTLRPSFPLECTDLDEDEEE